MRGGGSFGGSNIDEVGGGGLFLGGSLGGLREDVENNLDKILAGGDIFQGSHSNSGNIGGLPSISHEVGIISDQQTFRGQEFNGNNGVSGIGSGFGNIGGGGSIGGHKSIAGFRSIGRHRIIQGQGLAGGPVVMGAWSWGHSRT